MVYFLIASQPPVSVVSPLLIHHCRPAVPGIYLIKTIFSSSLISWANKLGRLPLVRLFSMYKLPLLGIYLHK